MAHLSILDRFRPVGAPGPAGPVGVPADDEPGYVAELAPVFAALAPDIESGRRMVDDAHREAEEIVAGARSEAAAILSRARLESVAARADVAAAVTRASMEQDDRTRAAARVEAARQRTAGETQIRVTADRVVNAMVTDQLTPRS